MRRLVGSGWWEGEVIKPSLVTSSATPVCHVRLGRPPAADSKSAQLHRPDKSRIVRSSRREEAGVRRLR